jgi:hypothetical protein
MWINVLTTTAIALLGITASVQGTLKPPALDVEEQSVEVAQNIITTPGLEEGIDMQAAQATLSRARAARARAAFEVIKSIPVWAAVSVYTVVLVVTLIGCLASGKVTNVNRTLAIYVLFKNYAWFATVPTKYNFLLNNSWGICIDARQDEQIGKAKFSAYPELTIYVSTRQSTSSFACSSSRHGRVSPLCFNVIQLKQLLIADQNLSLICVLLRCRNGGWYY